MLYEPPPCLKCDKSHISNDLGFRLSERLASVSHDDAATGASLAVCVILDFYDGRFWVA